MNGVHTDSNSLLKAVYLGRLRLTRLLLEGGAYINESNEHGETPLMIACKSRYSDTQGVPKAKMVAYLLESGADPNIQDKSGKTVLIHACLEEAGPDVVSLLLESGADPCLEDHVGSSALIYAINSNDEETLKLLMDAFKAKGKEVIIITTDRLVCGRPMAKQCLKAPLLDQWNNPHSSLIPCASPSEIHLSTSPQEAHFSSPSEQMFSFQDLQTMTNSQITLPSNKPPIVNRSLNKVNQLQRLHSEPWLKIPQSFLSQQEAKGNSQMDELPDMTTEEEVAFSIERQLAFNPNPFSCQVTNKFKEATSLSQSHLPKNNTSNNRSLRPEVVLPRNMSFSGLSSLYSLSHPDLHSKSSEFDTEKFPSNLAVSSLINIIQHRKLGMDHYSSDSQLSMSGNSPAGGKKQLDNRPLLTSRSSTLINAQESNESTFLGNAQKHHSTTPERRGSGAIPTDLPANPRPGFLPPLNHHPSIPQLARSSNSSAICSSNKLGCGLVTGTKQYLPSAPAGLPKDLKTRRMLMRRHSMQPDQIKQLGDLG